MESELLTEKTGKLYIRYLIPSMGGALATSVYSFVDTIAVGQSCGPLGAAAIAVINPLFALACFVGLLVGIGSSVLMSKAKGAGERDKSDRIFTSSLILLALLGILAWAFTCIFLRPILAFCGADDEIMPYAVDYMIPIAIGLPLFMVNTFLAPVIRYDERPGLVLKAVLTGGCLNIFGDWFFVFPLGMGMFGAGLATALGALTLFLAFRARTIGTRGVNDYDGRLSLLAAIAGMELDAVEIFLEGGEVPIMDGSAFPFAEAINETGYAEAPGETTKRSLAVPIALEENGGKRFLAAVPSEKLCVSYVIDYSGTPVGTQNVTYDVTRETFYNIISRARTFGLTSELEYLRRNGLAKGGSLDNALVFDGEGLVGSASLRFPLECVTHKVIDLLGDLTLAGPIPTAHYVAIAAGHSIHGKLARRIRTVFPL